MKSTQTKYLFVVALALAALFLLSMVSPKEGFASGGGEGANTLTLYYADWCPHCKAVKPVFEKLKKEAPIKVKGQMVFIDMAEADKDAAKMKAAGVKGFPTIKMEDDKGKIYEFDGERTEEGIRSWLSSTL